MGLNQKLTNAVKTLEKSRRPKFKYAIIVGKLEDAFSIGCTVSEACLYAGINRDTYYRWIKNNKTLSDKFTALLDKPILKARQTIVDNLSTPETAKWYLSRKRKKEFSPRRELTGGDGQPLLSNIKIIIEDFTEDDKAEENEDLKIEKSKNEPESK